MEIDFIQQVADYGLAAVVFVIVILWKRADDVRRERETASIMAALSEREDRLLKIVQDNTAALNALQAAIAQLATMDRLEDRLGRSGVGRGPRASS